MKLSLEGKMRSSCQINFSIFFCAHADVQDRRYMIVKSNRYQKRRGCLRDVTPLEFLQRSSTRNRYRPIAITRVELLDHQRVFLVKSAASCTAGEQTNRTILLVSLSRHSAETA